MKMQSWRGVGGAHTCTQFYGICGHPGDRARAARMPGGMTTVTDSIRRTPGSGWMATKDGIAECYYFDKDGWLLTDTTTPDGYQVNADGQWITYGQIRRVYSTAATIAAAKASGDKTYSPSNVKRNHGASGTFDEETGKRVGGVESPFTTTVY